MDIDRIRGYVQDILQAINAIQVFVAGHTIRSIESDDKTLSAVIRKFEIMGEASKRIPQEFSSAYPNIPWSSMAKLRDKLIHHYADVDLVILWETVEDILPHLKVQLSEALKTIG